MSTQKSSLGEYLSNSTFVLILFGAGLSAPSGIPTFRNNADSNFDPKSFATRTAFEQDPRRVWKYYHERRLQAQSATPNAAHYALAELVRWKPHTFTISQNIDGLSKKAGHAADKLAEIHGSLFHSKCSNEACACAQRSTCPESSNLPTSQITNSDEAFADAPRCPQCASILRPGVVWFGEPVLQLDRVEQWLSSVPRVDLMLVVGTSARVFPAAEYIHHAREKGAYIAQFNLERDDDHIYPGDWYVPGDVAVTLPSICSEAMC